MLKYFKQKMEYEKIMSVSKNEEIILNTYRERLDEIRFKMHFDSFENKRNFTFKNKRNYSFDYHLKSEFDQFVAEYKKVCDEEKIPLSPHITNYIPIFLPSETRRIAFFTYQSKSVRIVDIDNLETVLEKQARKLSKYGTLSFDKIQEKVNADLKAFKEYDSRHDFDGYRQDVISHTIQFNAYDKDDNILIEKSYVRGGLVFDLKVEDFPSIEITYPQRRKQRSDKKVDYLSLQLLQIRGIKNSKKKKKT